MTNKTGPAQQQGQPTQPALAGVLSRDQREHLMDLVNTYATAEADFSEALWRTDATREDKQTARLAVRSAHEALVAYLYGEVTP